MNRKKVTKESSGFTIVELLVVIVVIGILAAITIISYTGVSLRAAEASLKSDLKSVSTQLEIDKTVSDSEVYPSDLDAANNGAGFSLNNGTILQYSSTLSGYCLSATSDAAGTSAFHISSDTGVIEPDVCVGHTPPPGSVIGWTSIAEGSGFTCGLASTGNVYCWGSNDIGQLGDGSSTPSSTAVAVTMNGRTAKSIAAGDKHVCMVASDDWVYCWGANNYGQLGNDTTSQSSTPTPIVDANGVLSGKTIKSISLGETYSCAIASDDQPYCWGRNNAGQLGNNSTIQSNAPVAIVDTNGVLDGKTVKSISTSYYILGAHTCIVASDDQPYCWGYNNAGQLGNNTTAPSSVPVAIVDTNNLLDGKTIESITTGGTHTCAIASDDHAYCWGNGGNGQLGRGSNVSSNVPVAVVDGDLAGGAIKYIYAGYIHTCAVGFDNRAYCWGYGTNGSLGNNSTSSFNAPVAVNTDGVMNGKNITLVTAGNFTSCAVDSAYIGYCWGHNNSGQLGDETTTNQLVPVLSQQPPQE